MTIGPEQSFLDQIMHLYRAGDPTATEEGIGTQMVRQVQQVYAAIVLQDYARAVTLMTEDFEMEILGPQEIPITGCWKGREGIAEVLEFNFSQFENQAPQLIGVSAHRDAVLVMGRETGLVRSTQRPYSVHWVQWFTFRDLQLCRFLEIFDSDEISGAFDPEPLP